MTSVASVDLSGPHDPTPMPGERIGQKSARYLLALTVRPDKGHGHHDASCQTDEDPPPVVELEGLRYRSESRTCGT